MGAGVWPQCWLMQQEAFSYVFLCGFNVRALYCLPGGSRRILCSVIIPELAFTVTPFTAMTLCYSVRLVGQ